MRWGWSPTVPYRVGSRVSRLLPRRTIAPMAAIGGRLAADRSVGGRQMLERHLRRIDPSLESEAAAELARDGFASYVRYWIESFRLPTLDAPAVAAGMRVDGYRSHVLDGLAQGNGVILALPHLGGWEWAGRWIVDQGHGLTVVVERVEPPEVFDWFVDLRADLGMNIVPLGSSAAGEVSAALKRNDIVCLLCDRDIGGNGVEVSFFGAQTTLPAGPALLAIRSGAPLLPTAVYFTNQPDGHFGLVRAPLDTERRSKRLSDDVARITQSLAHELESLIERAPSQWHLLQPNWPDDPGYAGPLAAGPVVAGPTAASVSAEASA